MSALKLHLYNTFVFDVEIRRAVQTTINMVYMYVDIYELFECVYVSKRDDKS